MSKPLDIVHAETLAIAGLSFLATDIEQLSRFLALTGLDPSHIRESADSQNFLLAVLDFIASDESLLLAFAANEGCKPTLIDDARMKIGGAEAYGLREG